MPRGTDETINDAFEILQEEFNYLEEDGRTIAAETVEGLIAEGRITNENIRGEFRNFMMAEREELPEPDIDLSGFDNDTGVLHIGGAFNGSKHIKEIDNDIFYCPSENYCLFKCYEKYFKLIGKKVIFPTKELNPYSESKRKYFNVIAQTICPRIKNEKYKDYVKRKNEAIQSIPPIFKLFKKDNTEKIILKSVTSKHKVGNHEYRIGLININKNAYHAILLKKYKNLTTKDIKLEYTNKLILNNDWKKLKINSIKPRKDMVVVYDIETYSDNVKIELKRIDKLTKKPIQKDAKQLVPFSLGYQIISKLSSPNPEIGKYHEVIATNGNLFEMFFDDMKKNYYDLFKAEKEIQIFAHNGSKFDNIFLKYCKSVKFIDQIVQGNNHKMIRCIHNDFPEVSYVFKDTLPFCLSSLKRIAETLHCTKKMSFDIVNWSKQKYIDNMNTEDPKLNWRAYLKQDVETLSEVFIKLEKAYNLLTCSLTNNIGLPGIAYELMNKACFAIKEKTYIPKDPTIIQLILNATYGGRVQCLKRRFNGIYKKIQDKLISLDVNSEYPYGMTMGFPVGLPRLVEDKHKVKLLEEFKNHNDGKIKSYPHYLLTIKYRVPNYKISIIPQKENGKLYYPSNGEFVGTYNDVDIREMLIDNYEILEIENGIFWTQSEQIFTKLIQHIYDMRQKYKLEKNEMEYVMKILINAMYGKNLETIKSICYFSNEAPVNTRTTKLNNGQIQVIKKLDNPIVKKPIQYGCYILSYGRAILNEYIRKLGIENIYYSDTDSLYVPYSVFKNSGIQESKGLGGIKNDYGDNVFITEGIFLDIKRYFLQKYDKLGNDKSPISNKFIGLNFQNLFDENYISDGGKVCDTEEKKQIIKDFYNELAKNYDNYIIDFKTDSSKSIDAIKLIFDKWERTTLTVKIVKTELLYSIDPNKKGNLIYDNECEFQFTSLGFDNKKEEAKHGTNIKTLEYYKNKTPFKPYKIIGTNGKFYLKSALPITSKFLKGLFYLKDINFNNSDLGTSDYYVLIENNYSKIIKYDKYRISIKGKFENKVEKCKRKNGYFEDEIITYKKFTDLGENIIEENDYGELISKKQYKEEIIDIQSISADNFLSFKEEKRNWNESVYEKKLKLNEKQFIIEYHEIIKTNINESNTEPDEDSKFYYYKHCFYQTGFLGPSIKIKLSDEQKNKLICLFGIKEGILLDNPVINDAKLFMKIKTDLVNILNKKRFNN